jgi:mRNA-degrading endonuclease RelE of RelBE toxin-antitoxin system
MSYLVKLKKSVEKELDRLPERTNDRIIKALQALRENPFPAK